MVVRQAILSTGPYRPDSSDGWRVLQSTTLLTLATFEENRIHSTRQGSFSNTPTHCIRLGFFGVGGCCGCILNDFFLAEDLYGLLERLMLRA